jgi:tetratricopeptide (TPR) repeat protein
MEAKDSYYYYCTGVGHFEKGDFEAALENFLKSSEMDPHFKTSERISSVLRKLKRFEEADRFLEQAYRLNPKNDKTGTEYAGLLLRRGEISSVKEVLKEILCRNPAYGPGWKLAAELGKRTELTDIIDKVKEKSGCGIPGPGQKLIAELGKKSEFADIIDKVKEKSGWGIPGPGQNLIAELEKTSAFGNISEKLGNRAEFADNLK